MELNPYVGFTQCPQFFHEMQDKLDYLDNNNAQFFRLNCMIRNCCRFVKPQLRASFTLHIVFEDV